MKTTTSTPLSFYPTFMPNQVLTDDDLNRLVKYLDSHERLTRTHLIGMGIIHGMDVSISKNGDAVNVTTGCGLTSDGYLISLSQETTLTYYRALEEDPEQVTKQLLFGGNTDEAERFEAVKELFAENDEDRDLLSAEMLENQVLVVVYEYHPQNPDTCFLDEDSDPLKPSFWLRFFLLPASEPGLIKKSAASGTSKSLLTAEYLLRQGYSISTVKDLPKYWQDEIPKKNLNEFAKEIFQARSTFFQKYMPRVRRFGYVIETDDQGNKTVTVSLKKITDYRIFLNRYYSVCQEAIGEITSKFPKLFTLFSPFFSSFQPNTAADFKFGREKDDDQDYLTTKLEEIVPEHVRVDDKKDHHIAVIDASKQCAIQYFYDYLSTLVAAYEELAEAAFDLMDDAPPDTQRFPKFLMLGPVDPRKEPAAPLPYRSHFIQPPIYNGNRQRIQRVRYLYERLTKLCQKDSFNLSLDPNDFFKADLIITPSNDASYPLSHRAIPYYLDYATLYDSWNFDAHRKGISDSLPAYYSLGTPKDTPAKTSTGSSGKLAKEPGDERCAVPRSTENVTEILNYRLDSYDFYRVEGLVGKDLRMIIPQMEGAEGAPKSIVDQILEFEVAFKAQDKHSIPFNLMALLLKPSHWKDFSEYTLEISRNEPSDSPNKKTKTVYVKLNKKKAEEKEKESYHVYIFDDAQDPSPDKEEPLNPNSALHDTLLSHDEGVFPKKFQLLQRVVFSVGYTHSPDNFPFFFHKFADKYPGMEHLGGVPKGGTFILVYAHILDILNVEPKDFSNIFTEEMERLVETNPALVKSMLHKAGEGENASKAAFSTSVHKGDVKFELDPDWIEKIVTNLSSAYVVVADFYLPYRYHILLSELNK